MKILAVAALCLVALSASAQTVTSTTTTVTLTGSGFSLNATVSGPQGACTVISNSATQIIARCPNSGTYTVTNPPSTYPYVLKDTPTSLAFAYTVGGPAPSAQTVRIFDSSPCPPVAPVPYCAWPGTTVTSDSPWLSVTPASGTTAFVATAAVNASGLAAGVYSGNLIVTQSLFTTPTLKIPVALTVTAASSPSVSLTWTASTSTVSGYNVYRGTASGGPYTKINAALIAGLAYKDVPAGAGTYYYVATAVDSSGNESVDSNQATAVFP